MCPEQVYLQRVIQWNFLEVAWNYEPTFSAGVGCTQQWLDMSPNDVHVVHSSTSQKPWLHRNSTKMTLFPRKQIWKRDHLQTHLPNFYIIEEAAQKRADLLMGLWLDFFSCALSRQPLETTTARHNLRQLEACCQQRVQRRGMGRLASVLSKVCIRQIHSCRPHTFLAIFVFLLSALYRRKDSYTMSFLAQLVVRLFKEFLRT